MSQCSHIVTAGLPGLRPGRFEYKTPDTWEENNSQFAKAWTMWSGYLPSWQWRWDWPEQFWLLKMYWGYQGPTATFSHVNFFLFPESSREDEINTKPNKLNDNSMLLLTIYSNFLITVHCGKLNNWLKIDLKLKNWYWFQWSWSWNERSHVTGTPLTLPQGQFSNLLRRQNLHVSPLWPIQVLIWLNVKKDNFSTRIINYR